MLNSMLNHTEYYHFRHPLSKLSEKNIITMSSSMIQTTEIPTINFTVADKVSFINNFLNSVSLDSDDRSDIWHPVIFKTNSSFLFGSDDHFYFINATMINQSFFYDGNDTYSDMEETIKLMTTVGIAALLGFIILATVIER